ncbi:nicotinate-nucleotide adenylyltransferase [Lysobacter korlensis]|uniref:Probable nicotinate-nucleotide adenylyltransferase n=1 Tax=Lysobacter korlensis TaxID=553636 RepID=A0ABV6RPS4_9GAMM
MASGEARADELLLLYGGTFDPVHHGHLAIARSARDRLDTVVNLMPAADPPHRSLPGANAGHRANMLDLAVSSEPGLVVDRRELVRSGRSYTVDTLRELRARAPQSRPVALLLGADSFAGLPQWKQWRALFGLAHFVVAERPGSDLAAGLAAELAAELAARETADPQRLRTRLSGAVLRLHQPLIAASATQVRQAIAAGGDWQALVPASVAEYIVHHRLYAAEGAASAPL